ncbi:hypothetical protein EHR23_23910 [Escherichia coli]|nr:hypothetical protein [Escherichia coli]EFN9654946.1 hypothetical protein [Escherichia coli]EFN9870976.1 hypothetical protein [Escherichia coli]
MFQCINQLFAFSLSFIHFPFEKVGIYVTNTGLMATYGGHFTLTFIWIQITYFSPFSAFCTSIPQ